MLQFTRTQTLTENCYAIISLMTSHYEESKNCRRELTYADTLNKPVFPCFVDSNYKKAKSWLGILTAGLKYYDLVDHDFSEKCSEMCKDIAEQSGASIENVKIFHSAHQQRTLFDENFKGRAFMWKSECWHNSLHFDSMKNCYKFWDYDYPGNKESQVYGEGRTPFTAIKILSPNSVSVEHPYVGTTAQGPTKSCT